MKIRHSFNLIVPTVLFGMVLSIPAFAQNEPTSQQMDQAGQKIEQAGSDTAAAAKDAYSGTERAVKDTTITAEVKTALARDKERQILRNTRQHDRRSCNSEGQRVLARDRAACDAARGTSQWSPEREQPAHGDHLCEHRLVAHQTH